MSEWQPIETARKEEGLWLLGCVAGSKIPVPICYCEDALKWYPLNAVFRDWEPTHWMPLPDPPVAA